MGNRNIAGVTFPNIFRAFSGFSLKVTLTGTCTSLCELLIYT